MSTTETNEFASEIDRNALQFIQNNTKPVTTRDVADACNSPRSTTYDALRRLNNSGHIERKKNGNSVEWYTTSTDTPSTQNNPSTDIPSSLIPSAPHDITGPETKELREAAGLSALEVTAAGEFYLSDITAWEAGEIELHDTEKKALVSFITTHAQ